VNLNAQSLDVVCSVRTAGEIAQVELNLVPSFVKSHGHGADERLDSSGRLVIRGPKSSAYILVVQHLNFKGEVFLQILDNHHQERKLDAESFLRVRRTCDVVRTDVGSHNLKHT